jgi:hypothetical protein
VGGEDHANSNAQDSQAVTGAGEQNLVDQRAHGAFLVVQKCLCVWVGRYINQFISC